MLEQCEFPFKCSSDENLFQEFEEQRELGKGSYGVVVQAKRKGVKGVWAIGDCVEGPWLAHKASHEGVTAAEAIAQELGNFSGIGPGTWASLNY